MTKKPSWLVACSHGSPRIDRHTRWRDGVECFRNSEYAANEGVMLAPYVSSPSNAKSAVPYRRTRPYSRALGPAAPWRDTSHPNCKLVDMVGLCVPFLGFQPCCG